MYDRADLDLGWSDRGSHRHHHDTSAHHRHHITITTIINIIIIIGGRHVAIRSHFGSM